MTQIKKGKDKRVGMDGLSNLLPIGLGIAASAMIMNKMLGGLKMGDEIPKEVIKEMMGGVIVGLTEYFEEKIKNQDFEIHDLKRTIRVLQEELEESKPKKPNRR